MKKRNDKQKKKPSRITVSDVGLALAIINLIVIFFCEVILK